jgi:cell division protein FtsB
MQAMTTLREIRRRAVNVVGPFLGLTAVVYFSYHTLQGDRGLFAWWRVKQEVLQAEQDLSYLRAEYARLDHRVGQLRTDRLDPDMLEERARIMLNMGRDDEVIVFHHRP